MTRLRKKLNSRGFTLAETLMALTILLIVLSVVTAGIPSAVRAMNEVVETSNAQMLLSTTMTRLRDELGKAQEVSCSGTEISYVGSDGVRCSIDCVDSGTAPGIYIYQYSGSSSTPESSALLVSDEAANRNLYMSYDIDQAYTGGVLTISDLSVIKGSDVVFKIDTFKIRVLTDAQ